MNKIIYALLSSIFYIPFILPNGGPPPPPPLYKAKNVSSVYQPPLITGKTNPGFFLQTAFVAHANLDGKTNLSGTTTDITGIENGKNFEWQTPTIVYNLGIIATVSDYSEVVLNFGMEENETLKFSGLEIGFNTNVLREEYHYLRLGVGLNIHPTEFYWYQNATSKPIHQDKYDYDPYIQIIYNSDFPDWIINPFLQLSYSKQTLMDTNNDQYSSDVYKNVDVLTATPGIKYNWGENFSFSLGTCVAYVSEITNSNNLVLMPLVQARVLFNR